MAFDLFISYPRRDDKQARVTELKEEIERTFLAAHGRPLEVFFDTRTIQGMDDWRLKIQRSLRDSHLFMAIVSPNYLRSTWCRAEWEDYVRYEAMRQCLGEGIAPVIFLAFPGSTDPAHDAATASLVAEIEGRHGIDLRTWSNEGRSALLDPGVRATFEQLHATLCERLDRAERARRSPTNLLRHNPWFVGRGSELRGLRRALAGNKLGVIAARGASRAAVQGLGGMGKTELALAYAHAFAWDYPGGRWHVAAEHMTDLRLALIRLSGPMQFAYTEEEAKDPALAFERVRRELSRRERCLLLLDNVSEARLLEPEILDRLPRDGHVDVIATTRLPPGRIPGSAQGLAFIAVDELPEEDALALMRSHQPEGRFASAEEDERAREIVRLLDRFTLAVETAAIFLGRHERPEACREFRDRLRASLLRESETAASDPSVAVRHRERLLEKTLAFTLETLGAEAAHLLSLASLLPADQVALPWLAVLTGLPEETVGREVELLIGLRLFQSTDFTDAGGHALTVRMHRLVQALLLSRVAEETLAARREAVNHFAQERVASLERATRWEEARWEMEPLEALALRWADEGGPDAAWLLNQVSARWLHLAEFARAEPLMRRALEIDEAAFGAACPEVAAGLNNLAQLLKETNRLHEAEELMRRALEIDETCFGADSPEAAAGQLNLGGLLKATNRLTDAERHIRRALEIEERHFGTDHLECVNAINNLGSLLKEMSRYAEAEPLMRRALAILDANGGSDHHYYAAQLNNLASMFYRTNRLAEAEPLFRRALKLGEARFGPEHPQVARRLSNLAQVLQSTDRFAEAEPLMRRALEIVRKAFGPAHPEVATRLSNLAQLLEETGRADEAETLMRQALEIDEASLGADHPKVAIRLNNLARLLHHLSRPEDAEPLFRRALKINESSYGPRDPNVARDLVNLGQLLAHAHRLEEAEPMLRRALEIDEACYGPEHPEVAVDLSTLGQLLHQEGRLDEAEHLLRRALEIERRGRGENHTSVACALNNLAVLYQDMNRVEEADRLFRRALEIDEHLLGANHINVGLRLNNLGTLLREQQRPDEAAEVLRRGAFIFLRFTAETGHFHAHLPAVMDNLLTVWGETAQDDGELAKRVRELCDEAGLSAEQRAAIFSE